MTNLIKIICSIAVTLMVLSTPAMTMAASAPVDCKTDPNNKQCLAAEPKTDPNACTGYNNCDLIKLYINPAIDLLSAAFGLIAVVSLILGGIEYSSAEGDPQKSTRAKNRIAKTIVAVAAYFFLYAFLQFIIPGGVFNSGS